MKDKVKLIPIDELVGLKSKIHSLETLDNKTFHKGKGVCTNLVANIRIFVCVFGKKIMKHSMKRTQSK